MRRVTKTWGSLWPWLVILALFVLAAGLVVACAVAPRAPDRVVLTVGHSEGSGRAGWADVDLDATYGEASLEIPLARQVSPISPHFECLTRVRELERRLAVAQEHVCPTPDPEPLSAPASVQGSGEAPSGPLLDPISGAGGLGVAGVLLVVLRALGWVQFGKRA